MNRFIRIALAESRAELVKTLRTPGYWIPTVAFSGAFYAFFALVANRAQGDARLYLLGSFAAFGVMGAALFGFGVGVATERGAGWLLLKRASPMPIATYILARTTTAMFFALAIVAELVILAFTGGTHLPLGTLGVFALTMMAGAIPFCAIGLALGLQLPATSAAPTVNLIYLPMSFLSGLWIPLAMLPTWLHPIAHVLPAYHLAGIAEASIGNYDGATLTHCIALAAYALVFAALAALAWRRGEAQPDG